VATRRNRGRPGYHDGRAMIESIQLLKLMIK
jgi:hypothetical protein